LLGTIIEQVTGERLEGYHEKEVFKPLGLNKSFFEDTDDLALRYSDIPLF
jgi:CubicO group peptidase (beta-lactamase class C family)